MTWAKTRSQMLNRLSHPVPHESNFLNPVTLKTNGHWGLFIRLPFWAPACSVCRTALRSRDTAVRLACHLGPGSTGIWWQHFYLEESQIHSVNLWVNFSGHFFQELHLFFFFFWHYWVVVVVVVVLLLLSKLYPQCGTWTHNSEVKSHMLYRPNQPGALRHRFFFF